MEICKLASMRRANAAYSLLVSSCSRTIRIVSSTSMRKRRGADGVTSSCDKRRLRDGASSVGLGRGAAWSQVKHEPPATYIAERPCSAPHWLAAIVFVRLGMNIWKTNIFLADFANWLEFGPSSRERIIVLIASGSRSSRDGWSDVRLDEKEVFGLRQLQ